MANDKVVKKFEGEKGYFKMLYNSLGLFKAKLILLKSFLPYLKVSTLRKLAAVPQILST